ncbi:uncharacterized protein SRS1_16551 [Sporisorium reilianum f. sp. reilianum]|uniref:Effector family protein Eff1 n=1 Tax=Sporisorium reilianum f. sp. reilianum TaxID=72559 RepID=A0A2N8UE47_9BASI|nr:uncharacterized protein SRS1_16551 [Sporisorium reilianum f. sp. reilianum]
MQLLIILIALKAAPSCVSAFDPPPSMVRIPELQLFPVTQIHPASSGRLGSGSVAQVATDPSRYVEVPTWSRHHQGEVSSSRDPPTSRAPPVLLDLLPPSQASSRDLTAQDASIPAYHGGPLTVLPVPAGPKAGPNMIHPSHYIPAVRQEPGGQMWGPFGVGMPKFTLQAYPLELPLFKHLYQGAHLEARTPWDFEEFIIDGKFKAAYVRFQPDPAMLRAIHTAIWDQLFSEGIEPRPVSTSGTAVQGDFLWPPVEVVRMPAADLDIPPSIRSQRIRQAISEKMHGHTSSRPRLFHLEVQVQGRIRHVLMVPGRDYRYVHLWRDQDSSQLWLFFEGMRPEFFVRKGYSNRLAFLGAMFLPKGAEYVLLQANAVKVAFPSIL